MNEVLARIREVFEESGKSQTEIGKMIKKTPQYIWRLINVDDLNPSDSVISDICRVFNVREEWLKFGAEPMRTNHIEFGDICREIGVKDPKARQAILDYYELSPDDKELFWKFIEKFMK